MKKDDFDLSRHGEYLHLFCNPFQLAMCFWLEPDDVCITCSLGEFNKWTFCDNVSAITWPELGKHLPLTKCFTTTTPINISYLYKHREWYEKLFSALANMRRKK